MNLLGIDSWKTKLPENKAWEDWLETAETMSNAEIRADLVEHGIIETYSTKVVEDIRFLWAELMVTLYEE